MYVPLLSNYISILWNYQRNLDIKSQLFVKIPIQCFNWQGYDHMQNESSDKLDVVELILQQYPSYFPKV